MRQPGRKGAHVWIQDNKAHDSVVLALQVGTNWFQVGVAIVMWEPVRLKLYRHPISFFPSLF
jgi:hypothetical protein